MRKLPVVEGHPCTPPVLNQKILVDKCLSTHQEWDLSLSLPHCASENKNHPSFLLEKSLSDLLTSLHPHRHISACTPPACGLSHQTEGDLGMQTAPTTPKSLYTVSAIMQSVFVHHWQHLKVSLSQRMTWHSLLKFGHSSAPENETLGHHWAVLTSGQEGKDRCWCWVLNLVLSLLNSLLKLLGRSPLIGYSITFWALSEVGPGGFQGLLTPRGKTIPFCMLITYTIC